MSRCIYTYEHFIILGDFNSGIEEYPMNGFCQNYSLKSLIKTPTSLKNPDNPSCIDLMLTNTPQSFKSSCVIETGLSDFHRMTVAVMKITYRKLHPTVKRYREL